MCKLSRWVSLVPIAWMMLSGWGIAEEKKMVRVPAVPLIVHDPYFSIWSGADRLNDNWPKHWSGVSHAMCGMVRIDGHTYRVMGQEPLKAPPMEQIGLKIYPTKTVYMFEAPGIQLELSFVSPMLPNDLDLFSRPVSYLTWTVHATDSREHKVAVYFDCTAELVVHEKDQQVVWNEPAMAGLKVSRIGSANQPILEREGDGTRIDWGYLYVAAPMQEGISTAIGGFEKMRTSFMKEGSLPEQRDLRMPRSADDDMPAAACVFNFGQITEQPVSQYLMVAYDDIFSVEYFGTRLQPYWQRNGLGMADLLHTAAERRETVLDRSEKFDRELMADMTRIGGAQYADLCALAYRQAMGAHKLVLSPDGRLMIFSKECHSGGFIGTVDVIYPAAPIFMLFNKELLKASVTPVFDYVAGGRWKFPYAPHDLGVYPKANGQKYGGGEETEEDQMPVEESGNMIILACVISQIDGDTKYIDPYWPLITGWVEYLKQKGFDPDDQLCTDDFAGHLAHNANLSIKSIMALGAYAKMCEMRGEQEQAAEHRQLAEQFVKDWLTAADEGDHYRLAFDQPNTWSQKYNLVWDRLLGLNLFPEDVVAKEIAYYETKLDRFGLPLDSRETYTKLDWEVWTATLAASQTDFDILMTPVYEFVQHAPQRVPLTDWYQTTDAWQQGFQARSVLGGVFIKMLTDEPTWKKWSSPAESK